MPGLVGMISGRAEKVNLDLMQIMGNSIRHRSWYKIDNYLGPRGNIAISRVHLNIINKDNQPFSARESKIKVFLHGEIYNDDNMYANPLEYVYSLYEKHGQNFATYLKGSFVVVVVDEDEDKVLVANDRIATKPMFYFYDGKTLYFSPEMKSLLMVPSLERKLNHKAVADFMATGYFIMEHTLIENIKMIEGATVLSVRSGKVSQHKYWTFNPEQNLKDMGTQYYRENLAELIKQGVRKRLGYQGTYGVLLSGGYDSRGILGCYIEERPHQTLHTISWGRQEDIPDSDCAVSKRLAEKLRADHRYYHISAEDVIDNFRDYIYLGEGLTDFPESFDVFFAIKEKQNVNIVLRGDHCFGDSNSYTIHDEITTLRALDIRDLRYMSGYQRVLKPSYYHQFCELRKAMLDEVSTKCRARNIHNRKHFFYLDIYHRFYLNPLNYVKTFAMESLTPLLDYDLIDFVGTWPAKYKIGKKFYRETVSGMFPELYTEIAQHHNMIDWADSFRSSQEIKQFIYKELIEKQSMIHEFVNKDNLKSELDAFFTKTGSPSGKTSLSEKALMSLHRYPTSYKTFHKYLYLHKKRSGKINHTLPTHKLIIRFLILSVWGDMFLGSHSYSLKV